MAIPYSSCIRELLFLSILTVSSIVIQLVILLCGVGILSAPPSDAKNESGKKSQRNHKTQGNNTWIRKMYGLVIPNYSSFSTKSDLESISSVCSMSPP